ncbi:hypothetical protein [Enhygromyxa salina]|nr:hypothetical protein [Enhygromyxa salina]
MPRVSATLVIDDTKAPEADNAKDESEPKPREASNLRGPMDLVRAEQISATKLRLQFSNPLGPLDGFDPNDFRISVLKVYSDHDEGGSRDYGYYYDFGYLGYGQALRFTAAQAGEVELDLQFTPGVDPYYCRWLESDYSYGAPGVEAVHGLFLHYAAGAIPVRDVAGNQLRNFGADWVLEGRADPPQTRRDLDGARARLAGQGLIPIACGPELPPGPR